MVQTEKEGVLLLHGLGRTRRSMSGMEKYLKSKGYIVTNPGYPSTKNNVAQLAVGVIPGMLSDLRCQGVQKIHAVTHSMGGILLRSYMAKHVIEEFGYAVMLCPPNQGSELIDFFLKFKLFRLIQGPAACELSTSSDSTPNRLGPIAFSTGVITGNKSVNPISACMIEGENDGKVSVKRTYADGVEETLVHPCGHSFIMGKRAVQEQTSFFLCNGRFKL